MITELGMERPTYDDLLTAQITRCKELFGEDIDTSEQTPLGKFIRIIVYDLARAYEDLEIAYYARFPNTASGINLDRLCPFAGITRNPATAAMRKISITGTPYYNVEMGFLVSTESNNVTFYTLENVILDGNGKGVVTAICTELGTIGNVPLGDVIEVTNPNADVEAVEDIQITVVGEDEESDYELRKRWTKAIAGSGSGTLASIRAEILRIASVESVTIIENDSEETDDGGRPAHSFECYVLAPTIPDADIAQAIFKKKPIGIRAYGQIDNTITDEYGYAHEIQFTRTTEINLKVNVEIKTNSAFEGEVGLEAIRKNIAGYVMGLGNGENVIRSKMYGYIHSVAGVTETTTLTISADGGMLYTEDNVECEPWEVARLFEDDVNVQVVTT